ncbi:MAG TPA: hypothetical protein VMV10_26030 [Pirellulales bacterium]|nr:hypothetical protein [Pirellulales bacterium]
MPMHSFMSEFPELGQAECRVMVVVRGDEGLPADRYALVEMYCNERGCDCRRVSLNVISETTGKTLCVISYGFDRDDPFSGPFIDPLNPRAKCADELLEMVDNLVLSDPKYVARLERHYRMFKEKVWGERQVARISGPVRLSEEQVAERISERKQRHKALRRAQQRRGAR